MAKATRHSIPACQRPATRQVRTRMFGRPSILDVCEYHFRRSRDGHPIPAGKLLPLSAAAIALLSDEKRQKKGLLPFVTRRINYSFHCNGCGGLIVRIEDDGLFGTKLGGLDFAAIRAHLDTCGFRSEKPVVFKKSRRATK